MLRPWVTDLTSQALSFFFFFGVCVCRKSYYKAYHPEGFLKDAVERAHSIAPGH